MKLLKLANEKSFEPSAVKVDCVSFEERQRKQCCGRCYNISDSSKIYMEFPQSKEGEGPDNKKHGAKAMKTLAFTLHRGSKGTRKPIQALTIENDEKPRLDQQENKSK